MTHRIEQTDDGGYVDRQGKVVRRATESYVIGRPPWLDHTDTRKDDGIIDGPYESLDEARDAASSLAVHHRDTVGIYKLVGRMEVSTETEFKGVDAHE